MRALSLALQGAVGLKGATDTQESISRGPERGKITCLLKAAQGCILGDPQSFSATSGAKTKAPVLLRECCRQKCEVAYLAIWCIVQVQGSTENHGLTLHGV